MTQNEITNRFHVWLRHQSSNQLHTQRHYYAKGLQSIGQRMAGLTYAAYLTGIVIAIMLVYAWFDK